MQLIDRASRVALVSLLLAIGAAVPAFAQTTVTSEAGAWFTPGAPAGNAVRAVVRVADADPGVAPPVSRVIRMYLPAGVALQGDGFPRCSRETIVQSGLEACPDGSQLGSGTVKAELGAARAPLAFDLFVINGSAPGLLTLHLALRTAAVSSTFEAQIVPSDADEFGSMLVIPIPPELQEPVSGVPAPITEFDVLLHANAGAPFVAIADCPGGKLGFKTVLDVIPTPLETMADASCIAGPPPAVNPMPRPTPTPNPVPQPPPPPGPPVQPSERAVAAFGVRLTRKGGKARRLRLSGVPANARVSVRCLRRCGRSGAELVGSRRAATVRLKRALRPRSRFELRVHRTGLVARYARYRVDRRARAAIRTKTGCLDSRGAARSCPAVR